MSDDRTTGHDPAAERVLALRPLQGDAGDVQQYLATVTTQCHARLRCWAQSLVGEGEADDVVQDALLRFWRRMERTPAAERPLDPYPQLARIVHDVARERHRDRSRRRNILTRVGGAATSYAAAHISSPFISGVRHWMTPGRRLELQEIDPLLRSAIDTLSERGREVFLLSSLEGMDTGEISAVLAISKAGVRQHMSRAIRELRAQLERAGVVRRGGARPTKGGHTTEVTA